MMRMLSYINLMKKDDEEIVQALFQSYFTSQEKNKKEHVVKLVKISELYSRKHWHRLIVSQLFACWKRLFRKDSFVVLCRRWLQLLDVLLQKQWRQQKESGYKAAISQSIVEYYTFIFPLIFEYRHQDLIIDFKTHRMLWANLITDEAFDQLRIQIKNLYKHIDLNKGFTPETLHTIRNSFQQKRFTEQQIQRYMADPQPLSQHNSYRQVHSSQDQEKFISKKRVKYDGLLQEVGSKGAVGPMMSHLAYNDHPFPMDNYSHPHLLTNYNQNTYPNRVNMQTVHPYLNNMHTNTNQHSSNTNLSNNNHYQTINTSNLNHISRSVQPPPPHMRNQTIPFTPPSHLLSNQQQQVKQDNGYLNNQGNKQHFAPSLAYQEFNNPTFLSNQFNNPKPTMKMHPPPPPPNISQPYRHIQSRQPNRQAKERQNETNKGYNYGSPTFPPASYKSQPYRAGKQPLKMSIQRQSYKKMLVNIKKSLFQCRECGMRFLTRQNLQKHTNEHFLEAQRVFSLRQVQSGPNVRLKQRLQNFDMLFDVNQWITSSHDKQDFSNFKVSINRLKHAGSADLCHHCFYCNEEMKMSWCEKLQEWCLQESVKIKEEQRGICVAHVNCYECFKADDTRESLQFF